MNETCIQKPYCRNEEFRAEAVAQLERLLADFDGRRGWFGELKVIIPVANGQFSGVRTSQEQNHKVK